MSREQTDGVSIGSRIAQLLTIKDVTRAELGEKIGADKSSISQWISGARAPSLSVLLKIAGAYDVSLDWLCGRAPMENRAVENDLQGEVTQLKETVSNLKADIELLNRAVTELNMARSKDQIAYRAILQALQSAITPNKIAGGV